MAGGHRNVVVNSSSIDPPSELYAVTKHDANADPNGEFRALSCATAGTVKVTMRNDVTGTFYLTAGVQMVGYFTRVWLTGTTAVDIVGWK